MDLTTHGAFISNQFLLYDEETGYEVPCALISPPFIYEHTQHELHSKPPNFIGPDYTKQILQPSLLPSFGQLLHILSSSNTSSCYSATKIRLPDWLRTGCPAFPCLYIRAGSSYPLTRSTPRSAHCSLHHMPLMRSSYEVSPSVSTADATIGTPTTHVVLMNYCESNIPLILSLDSSQTRYSGP
jgi:hypothetical protein